MNKIQRIRKEQISNIFFKISEMRREIQELEFELEVINYYGSKDCLVANLIKQRIDELYLQLELLQIQIQKLQTRVKGLK